MTFPDRVKWVVRPERPYGWYDDDADMRRPWEFENRQLGPEGMQDLMIVMEAKVLHGKDPRWAYASDFSDEHDVLPYWLFSDNKRRHRANTKQLAHDEFMFGPMAGPKIRNKQPKEKPETLPRPELSKFAQKAVLGVECYAKIQKLMFNEFGEDWPDVLADCVLKEDRPAKRAHKLRSRIVGVWGTLDAKSERHAMYLAWKVVRLLQGTEYATYSWAISHEIKL